jgi:Fe-S cluster assembly iron-binding protein IscA
MLDMVGEITLSERAVEKIWLLAGNSDEKGLRLKVVAGGCSGFGTKWLSMSARVVLDAVARFI